MTRLVTYDQPPEDDLESRSRVVVVVVKIVKIMKVIIVIRLMVPASLIALIAFSVWRVVWPDPVDPCAGSPSKTATFSLDRKGIEGYVRFCENGRSGVAVSNSGSGSGYALDVEAVDVSKRVHQPNREISSENGHKWADLVKADNDGSNDIVQVGITARDRPGGTISR
jgi:hypothetical protein